MTKFITQWLIASGFILIAVTGNASAAPTPNVRGQTYWLGGTLSGKVTQNWKGQGPATGSNLKLVVSDLTTINYTSVNAWPLWKAQLVFNADGTFQYWDIDLNNTQAGTVPSIPSTAANQNWRLYTGTWTQRGKSVTLNLDVSATGEYALYRFYGVNTVPALPASGDGLFAGQAATANVPSIYNGTESPNAPDYYFTYRASFPGNPSYDKRYYTWKGKFNNKGQLTLTQSTFYQVSDLQNIGFVATNPEAPPTDLYRVYAQFILTKSLTSQ
jgi:hypothetical protein